MTGSRNYASQPADELPSACCRRHPPQAPVQPARVLREREPEGRGALDQHKKHPWSEARKWAQEARVLVAERHLDEMTSVVPVFTAKAMVLAHDGDFDRAKPELAHAVRIGHVLRRARWIVADMNLRWGTISLQLVDRTAAREHADDARAALHGYPDPGTLPARLAQLDGRIARAEELHLTPAELQIAAFLPTHYSLREIAEALSVSRGTVKTHIAAIYAKLGVATRSEAVEQPEQLSIVLTAAKRA